MRYLLLLLVAFAAGCGPGYSVVDVSGNVTHKGKPLADANVNFTPQGGERGMGSYAKTDAQGHYTLQLIEGDGAGAAVGEHRVTITIASEENNNSIDPATKILPKKYRDGTLSFEVPAGGTDAADFDIP